MAYPENWPRCPNCDDHALDGHITCGRVECNESGARRLKAEMDRDLDRAIKSARVWDEVFDKLFSPKK